MRNLMLSAILLAASTAAFAAPPITLEVRAQASDGTDGYTDSTGSNGGAYSYRYSGGSGNGGDVEFVGRGQGTIVIHLRAERNFSLDSVSFRNDANDQLSTDPIVHSAKNATIKNRNTAVQTAEYKVTVMDSDTNETIDCDPKIINR